MLSTPFRVTVGNGQNDALALMCLGLWTFAATQTARGLLLGAASTRSNSLPPVLVIFLLLRRRWKVLFFSLILPLAGFLFVASRLHTGWITLALNPFRTEVHQKGGFVPGVADFMAIAETSLRHISSTSSWAPMLPYGLAIVLACAFAAYFARESPKIDGRILLACLLMASLVCFQHMIYDFLVLIFSLAVALKSQRCSARNMVFLLIAYFWYLERALGIWRWESYLPVIFGELLPAIAFDCGNI